LGQLRADPLAAELRQQAYSEDPAMRLAWPAHRRHITPANHFAIGRNGDELGMAALDIIEQESPCALDRRGLQERQIPPLPRHDIEGSMKAVDMVLAYRDNFDRVHVRPWR
jgi:hypothetical protein